ncbi:type II toxin-antitoxin system RelE/ParE family toxin [Aquiflexum sp.]|uniref:type II toxin-antitoxin system RelE/ParE family toxin n=1 Tax=Aquiflexum sp. TaxID=1872584 RepID=UPI0035933473
MRRISYNYRLSEEAEWDVYESFLWYENQRLGLGEEFLEELELAENAITSNPEGFAFRYKKKVRAYVMGRFPILILYIINGKNIDVIAVFNTNQHPKKWKNRV